jgi:methionyl-tRNA formyltransferase
MKIVFMGRKSYSAEIIEWTVKKGIKIVGIVTDSSYNPYISSVANRFKIPIMSLKEVEKRMDTNNNFTDLVVLYLYPEIIKNDLILNIPKYGCINFHPAILPNWRGTAGYNIAILNKLPEWGASVHYVDKSIDCGPIIDVKRFKFDYRKETAFNLEKKTQKVQADLYKSTMLKILKKGKLESKKQKKSEGIYISRKEMEELKEIDPIKDDIDLKIRAFWFPPYTGAYIKINNKKYSLINNSIMEEIYRLNKKIIKKKRNIIVE